MIKIKKLENVYGIKKLNNSNLIDGNTIIYSPNGVMKSSLTDGLETISRDENPKDVFNNIDASYEIENNGVLITEASVPKHLDLIVFKGEDIFGRLISKPDIAKIVVSTTLKKQYDAKISSIKSKIDLIKEALAVNVLEEKKGAKTSKIDDFLRQYGGSTDIENISNLLAKTHDNIKEDCASISYSSLFNSKTEPILNDSTFKTKAEEYQKLKDAKLNEEIFKNGFSILELQNMHDISVKSKYYSAGHKLSINNNNLDSEGVEQLIADSVVTAYGSEEMKTAFLNAKSILDKNNDSRKIVKAISDNKWLLEKLANPQQFKTTLVFKKIEGSMDEIMKAKKDIEEAKKDIERIFEEAKKTEPVWKIVIETYNQRFNNKHFDITITNQTNAVVGIQVPVFTKVFKGTDKEITEEFFQRFSSGEKRAIFILYFLFEIELMKQQGLPYTIVADDIVDSFDYKNKYAVIEYLSELAADSNTQLIVLTHNFDFYRSCRNAFGHELKSELFGYLDSNAEPSLFNAKKEDYESFKLFNKWKVKDDIPSLIALIPFLRNIVELQSGESSANYILLCDYLHFNLNTANLDLSGIASIYNTNGITHTSATNAKYWTLLINEIKALRSPIVESDIRTKLLLGLFIRLASDFLLLNKYRSNNSGANPVISVGSNWTKQLKKQAYSYLSIDEKKLFDRAITVAPSFIHVNSFMYEPLIDVGSEKLLAISREMITANSL